MSTPTISQESLAAVIRKLRRYRPEDSHVAYIVCEITDTLPPAERAAWHDMCAARPDKD